MAEDDLRARARVPDATKPVALAPKAAVPVAVPVPVQAHFVPIVAGDPASEVDGTK